MSTTAASLPAPAVLRTSGLAATQRRWQIRFEQMRAGGDPCFQTDRRHTCPEHNCCWRSQCLGLRAEWRR